MRIIGIAGDAEIRSIKSASLIYGEDTINAVLDSEEREDFGRNPLHPVFSTDEGAYEEICAGCSQLLGDCTCG